MQLAAARDMEPAEVQGVQQAKGTWWYGWQPGGDRMRWVTLMCHGYQWMPWVKDGECFPRQEDGHQSMNDEI